MTATGDRACCDAPDGTTWDGRILRYEGNFVPEHASEMRVRDAQAAGYLQHAKFGSQIERLAAFVDRVRAKSDSAQVLDLGSGPGPTTGMLVAAGYKVLAVDFSIDSLRLNAQTTGDDNALFVQADLTRLLFANEAVEGLMMADFLQHLGDAPTQRAFLRKAFEALIPGGWFYLSFFNINLKHRVKRDIAGSFAGGAIPYRRMTPREVSTLLPPGLDIDEIAPMNISHDARKDRWLARLPFARHAARMVAISGRKKR